MPRPSSMPNRFSCCRKRKEREAPRTPLMFDPGERWQYGTSIDWVGRIVEAVSGEPLDDYFRTHIFDPLGMNDTAFVISPQQRQREASAHRRGPDGVAHAAAGRAAVDTQDVLRRWRDLFDRSGLSDLHPHAAARRLAERCPHPASRYGRAHGAEPDRQDRSRRPQDDGAGTLQRCRFLSGRRLQMGLRSHDQHAGHSGRPQRRQPDLGRPSQHLLLDRSCKADRRRLHGAGLAVRGSPDSAQSTVNSNAASTPP